MHPDDEAAVARAKGGDEDAFRVLVERHGRNIYRLAYRMTGRAEDAQDVTQETFVRAYRQLSRFEARSNFATWLYRIGFNCAVDYLRARPSREQAATHEALDGMVREGTQRSTEDLVYASEVGARIDEALGGLSAQERAAFLMRHYHGCSIDEISEALNVKTNAAKHSIFRAVRKLRAALRPCVEPAHEPGSGRRCMQAVAPVKR